MKNKLIIAAAGSGKTTFLVQKALTIQDENVLITTFTEANAEEISRKITKIKGCIPNNITVQTWFSFLLQHGVRPYQSLMNNGLENRRIGFYLTEKPSGFRFVGRHGNPVYWGEKDFGRYYFTKDIKIYSDKIAQFIIKCDEKSSGEITKRISDIFQYIFIDEIQDLAGWELEFIKLLLMSNSSTILVGDPRQVTYLTHHPRKYTKYKFGKIASFIENECEKGVCEIDTDTLSSSHRNNLSTCQFSAKIFPEYPVISPCDCIDCRSNNSKHQGVYLLKESQVETYINSHKPTILRWSGSSFPEWNFGKSKGLTFDNVLIFPTQKIKKWLNDNSEVLPITTKCKFYVAVTRAKFSTAIVVSDSEFITNKGIMKYEV